MARVQNSDSLKLMQRRTLKFVIALSPRADENFPLFSYLSDSKNQTITEKVLLANDRGN